MRPFGDEVLERQLYILTCDGGYKKMTIETTYILKADEGKMLRNKIDGIETPSVWLKIGDSKDDWEEIDAPEPEPEPEPEVQ